MSKAKVKLKPEGEWTEDDRLAKTSMESFHGGTWRPTADGGLVRVSKRGPWKDAGDYRSRTVVFEFMKDLAAINGRLP